MISHELARRLVAAGLGWSPSSGDRFVIPDRGMDDEVFHVAEMTIEVHRHHGQGVLGFNGTTEWALDSIPASDVLWLPREDQLRTGLGDAFVALEHEGPDWVVTYAVAGANRRVRRADVEDAYATALVDTLTSELDLPDRI